MSKLAEEITKSLFDRGYLPIGSKDVPALIDEKLFEVLQFIQDIMKYDKGLDGEIARDLYESLKVD